MVSTNTWNAWIRYLKDRQRRAAKKRCLLSMDKHEALLEIWEQPTLVGKVVDYDPLLPISSPLTLRQITLN